MSARCATVRYWITMLVFQYPTEFAELVNQFLEAR
jgi:hypothetical protein